MNRKNTLAYLAAATVLLAVGAASAQSFNANLPVTLDRWNYPFGDFGGARTAAPIFWTVGAAGFDDRDAEFLIGFNTTGVIAPGGPASIYAVTSLNISATVSVSNLSSSFQYDPTHDLFNTYFEPTDPAYAADSDIGRPIEIFACGYRPTSATPGAPLWTATTFRENSPFASVGANPPPARNNRNVFPVSFSAAGTPANCSNHVTGTAAEGGRFEVTPLAVGQAYFLTPGELVPDLTEFTFTLDLSNPGALAYVQAGLAEGRLNFIISSLHASSQPGSGGAPLPYPTFYTKENPFGIAARLSIAGSIGGVPVCGADVNADGVVDGNDFVAFINSFSVGDVSIDPVADVNLDNIIDGNDFVEFINAFGAGC